MSKNAATDWVANSCHRNNTTMLQCCAYRSRWLSLVVSAVMAMDDWTTTRCYLRVPWTHHPVGEYRLMSQMCHSFHSFLAKWDILRYLIYVIFLIISACFTVKWFAVWLKIIVGKLQCIYLTVRNKHCLLELHVILYFYYQIWISKLCRNLAPFFLNKASCKSFVQQPITVTENTFIWLMILAPSDLF